MIVLGPGINIRAESGFEVEREPLIVVVGTWKRSALVWKINLISGVIIPPNQDT